MAIQSQSTARDYRNKFYVLQASGFKGQVINATRSLSLPFCEMRVTNKASNWVHWQQGQNEKPRVLINISPGDVTLWSPFGSAQGKYSHSELRWKWYNLNGPLEISTSVNEPIQWPGVGMASLLQFGNSVQTNLWKMASAFHPHKAWERKFNIKDDKYNLSFRLNQSYPFLVCS